MPGTATWTYWPHSPNYFATVEQVTRRDDPRLVQSNLPRWARGEYPGTGKAFDVPYVPSQAEIMLAERSRQTAVGLQDAGCHRDAGAWSAVGSLPPPNTPVRSATAIVTPSQFMTSVPLAINQPPPSSTNAIALQAPAPPGRPTPVVGSGPFPGGGGATPGTGPTPPNGMTPPTGDAATPAADKPLPLGWIVGGSLAAVTAVAGGLYLALRKKRRRGKARGGR